MVLERQPTAILASGAESRRLPRVFDLGNAALEDHQVGTSTRSDPSPTCYFQKIQRSRRNEPVRRQGNADVRQKMIFPPRVQVDQGVGCVGSWSCVIQGS